MEISEKIKFHDVCTMLEKIRRTREAKAKEQQLRKYLDSFYVFQENFKKSNETIADASFYCILRLLIPNADTARESYGIQETVMARLYIKILNLSPNSEDALKLTYKSPKNEYSNFAEIVFNVMKGRSTETSNKITLAEVHKILDTIAEKDIRTKEQTLSKFIETSTALEQKWLIRIILKKLHLGIGEQKIFSVYHPNAKDLYTTHTDLKNLCKQIESGGQIERIADNVCPMKHVRPMLCTTLDITVLNQLTETKVFYLETKMDGERFQIHVVDEIYKYLSRNGKDYTMHFGRTSSEGNLTPLLCKLFNRSIKNIILDGEMMVWDKSLGSYRVKGENIDVKHLQIGGNLRPCFVVYDLLYMNDVSYIDAPYEARIDLLRNIMKEQYGVLSFCKRDKLRDLEHFKECFNRALNQNEEGVVIKNQTSKYLPGYRGGGWYKVKAEYIKGLVTDLDLLIIGGFYNKTRNFIDSYLVGVYKKLNDQKGTFYSVGRISSGLSSADQKAINESLKRHWIPMRNKRNGELSNIEFGSTIPDVRIEPENSIILQIKASELSPNSSFGTRYALRFGRVEAIRNDKVWNECMTLEEYEKFYKNDFGVKKINKRILTDEDFLPAKRVKSTPTRNNFINPYISNFRAEEIQKVSEEFGGINICILSGCKQKGKTVNDLKRMVFKHGGRIVENPTPDHKKCISVAGDFTSRVQKLKATGLFNIVSMDWLIRAFSGDKVLSKLSRIKPSDMIHTTPEMREKLSKLYDQYGDSYTEKIDVEELKQLLDNLNSTAINPLMDCELFSLERELCLDESVQNVFRMEQGCFYSSEVDFSKILILAKLIFESRGGCILNSHDSEQKKKIKYIFVDAHDTDADAFKLWLKESFEKRLSKVQIVSYQWIFDCNVENKRLNISNYLVSF